MDIHVDSYDIIEMFPAFFGGMILIFCCSMIFMMLIKKSDNNKPLITKKVKILEKPISQGNIAWYVVECEGGERLRLRSFQNNSVFITVGDIGILSYRGQTIKSFERCNS